MKKTENIILCIHNKEVLSAYTTLLEKIDDVLGWQFDLSISRAGRNCINFINTNTSNCSTVIVDANIPWELYTKNKSDAAVNSIENALRLLREIKIKNPLINVILISRSGTQLEVASQELLKEFVSNYLKHINFERKHVNRYARECLEKEEFKALEDIAEIKYIHDFVQALTEMRNRYFTDIRLTSRVRSFDDLKSILVPEDIRPLVLKAAEAQIDHHGLPTALLVGPVGTGKTSIGKIIQSEDPLRNKRTFLEVNLQTIPPDMMAAELFGYRNIKKFSPVSDKVGFFQRAHNGILFLDEICHLPLSVQNELVKIIKMNSILRINTRMRVPVNVKIIAASKHDLKAKIVDGDFNKELYEILSRLEIKIPALSERPDDIVHTINFYCKKYSRAVTNDVIEYFISHPPKENLREIKTTIEKLATISSSKLFNIADVLKVLSPPPVPKKERATGKINIDSFLAENLDNIATVGSNRDNYDFSETLFPIFSDILNAIGEQQFALKEHINLDNLFKGFRKYLIYLYYSSNREKFFHDKGLAKILGINDVSIRKIFPKKTIHNLITTKK